MTTENYKLQLEQLLEYNDAAWPSSIINKLSKRANELQFESDFTIEDIHDELEELIPSKIKDDEDEIWFDIIEEYALFIFDEKENIDDDELTPEED